MIPMPRNFHHRYHYWSGQLGHIVITSLYCGGSQYMRLLKRWFPVQNMGAIINMYLLISPNSLSDTNGICLNVCRGRKVVVRVTWV
ncbi:hypothetical protein GDO86_011082 [Hymenochirus boettgeri]|uniref:Uncharacterized protein n=1 Tax=Hymenochirus boettgeri TaxID=247094 RepID=A0A8T2JI58_9PIPI|nr:hypothetical protein GDO86_011082 [Hymenochirus boettgeri]